MVEKDLPALSVLFSRQPGLAAPSRVLSEIAVGGYRFVLTGEMTLERARRIMEVEDTESAFPEDETKPEIWSDICT